jgi:hypothetical protein
MSLYLGETLERHIDSIIGGGKLEGYNGENVPFDIQNNYFDMKKSIEDRNRTGIIKNKKSTVSILWK